MKDSAKLEGVEMLGQIQEMIANGKISSLAVVAMDVEGDPVTGVYCPAGTLTQLLGGLSILQLMVTGEFLNGQNTEFQELGNSLGDSTLQ